MMLKDEGSLEGVVVNKGVFIRNPDQSFKSNKELPEHLKIAVLSSGSFWR